ncbi:MAG: FAD-dependent oxidoreductase [Limisphaerales bacterium]
MKNSLGLLSDAQLKAELSRCEYCEGKPCQQACPAHCSPADFIMAARVGAKSDYRRAAAMIMGANPLGWVCGVVCPDTFCMEACSRRTFDRAINIPAVQATVMKKGYDAGLPKPAPVKLNGKSVAVIGAGPAGFGAAGVLARKGYRVTIFEKEKRKGGALNLIPNFRLGSKATKADVDYLGLLGAIEYKFGKAITEPEKLLGQFDAVIVSAGLQEGIKLDVPGEELAVSWKEFLQKNGATGGSVKGKRVAVIGGGAVAVDCATTAKLGGAAHVELIYRRKQENMPLTEYEREMLLSNGIEIATCSKPIALVHQRGRVKGLKIARMILPPGKKPLPKNFVISKDESPVFRAFDVVVSAIGSRPQLAVTRKPGVFYAGDIVLGAGTVVEASASGKNAALQADAFIQQAPKPVIKKLNKSVALLEGVSSLPVSIEADFFGRKILSPLLLSAAPHSDGYAQMRKAYERGWAGGVMKTAFDNVHIHIPAEYMFVLGRSTYGNCDNVSGHSLERVCTEVEMLVREFPDRLTMASTGGPVTGNDEADRAVWQSNTRKLENAGAMGVEYSLSCPQGGDGANGDVVSQNAALTAKIIGWVMEAGRGDVPKLFKLTGAVTAIQPIIKAILEVYERYPEKKAGVTLANSFPSLAFRPSNNGRRWDEGVVIGMSGEGVLPISNLTLAKVAGMGITVSGNGGAMTYRDAANFLALGAKTVQFCTTVMKYGLGVVDELHSGLSWMLQDRGMKSVEELIGSAWPQPITGFEQLTSLKKLPQVTAELCQSCGNCTRCPYLAITLDKRGVPVFDPSLCVGCSLCAQKCFASAISMRVRTRKETKAFEVRESMPAGGCGAASLPRRMDLGDARAIDLLTKS